MSLVRPSTPEQIYKGITQLNRAYPEFYISLYGLARNFFMSLGFDGSQEGFDNKVKEMDDMIIELIEIPYDAQFPSVVRAFDRARNIDERRAFTFIGEGVDQREVNVHEILTRLEAVRNWIMDEVTQLSMYIRMTSSQPMVG